MKNIGHYILLSIACIALGFMLGIFVGRGTDGQAVDLIPVDLVTEDALPPNFAYRDESVGRVDINTASVEELTTVPGIGKTTAQHCGIQDKIRTVFYCRRAAACKRHW